MITKTLSIGALLCALSAGAFAQAPAEAPRVEPGATSVQRHAQHRHHRHHHHHHHRHHRHHHVKG
ncbi:MAG TPA: hypothetical protein VNU71_16390 [Burkholderiaceae bacterium]|nr:hypothetical protein [Burkholderiaceae bacterium]